jgi:hypothetical protein
MDWHRQSELDVIVADAQASLGLTPEQRLAAFVDLMATIDAIQEPLPFEERLRRTEIARQLDPLPDPWWRNFRPEALAEYQCKGSSS